MIYYRIDLRDLFSDTAPLSPRYVIALMMHLPPEGAFFAERAGGAEFRGWDSSRWALVTAVNELRTANYIQVMINRDPKKAKPAPPEPFPTPGAKINKSQKPGSFAAIAASMMAAQKRKKELLNVE